MTRYNRFHNQKNDSNIHDIVGNKPRQQSCDLSDGLMRSTSRHGVHKNKRNDSTFNMITGEEKMTLPITYGKKMFPERDFTTENPIL
jgi:hypothetical protein